MAATDDQPEPALSSPAAPLAELDNVVGTRCRVLRAFHAIPEVEDVAVVAGSTDLLARIRLRDHARLRALMLEQVWKIPGVQRTETLPQPGRDAGQAVHPAAHRGAGGRRS